MLSYGLGSHSSSKTTESSVIEFYVKNGAAFLKLSLYAFGFNGYIGDAMCTELRSSIWACSTIGTFEISGSFRMPSYIVISPL